VHGRRLPQPKCRERLTGGDPQLIRDDVAAGNRFGDRVLTCSRVFISRKKKSPESVSSISTVPALTYPTDAATRNAASPMRSRSGADMDGAGASSRIFWLRRCALQSRSPR